ncbi:shikimate kinase [soil metagenome]
MSSVIAPGRNIVLIGLMGAGKTTVGRLLARTLGRPFIDTDELIESEQRRPIAAIFEAEGERVFRSLEAAAIRRVSALRGQVLAVGGGAVTDPTSVTLLRGTGDLVWLDAPVSAMAMHLSSEAEQGKRPLLSDPSTIGQTLERLRAERADAYAGAAAFRIDTQGRPPEVLADEVLAWALSQHGLLAREER